VSNLTPALASIRGPWAGGVDDRRPKLTGRVWRRADEQWTDSQQFHCQCWVRQPPTSRASSRILLLDLIARSTSSCSRLKFVSYKLDQLVIARTSISRSARYCLEGVKPDKLRSTSRLRDEGLRPHLLYYTATGAMHRYSRSTISTALCNPENVPGSMCVSLLWNWIPLKFLNHSCDRNTMFVCWI